MSTNTYKLLISGFIQDVNTGATHPPTRANYLSNAVMQELVDAKLAKEDRTGIFVLKPDGKLLIQEVAAPTTGATK